jgi:hypothetical protein
VAGEDVGAVDGAPAAEDGVAAGAVAAGADVSDAVGEVAVGALGAAADGAAGLTLSLAAGGDATGDG